MPWGAPGPIVVVVGAVVVGAVVAAVVAAPCRGATDFVPVVPPPHPAIAGTATASTPKAKRHGSTGALHLLCSDPSRRFPRRCRMTWPPLLYIQCLPSCSCGSAQA